MNAPRLLTTSGLALILAGLAPAGHAQDRSVLPIPAAAFDGRIAENVMDSQPGAAPPVRAPQGAPNVLMFMSDDVGFAMASVFGGPVPTPNFARLAERGQRYNRFHTTGICSPSRAALLTGRNHHNAGVGWLSDIPSGYPGYGGRIVRETATIAQILRFNGWNTAMFGKHHNIPSDERSMAGPFDAWPTGLGFEYYYGFPYGDSDQFSPVMYRGIHPAPQSENDGRLVDQMLADEIITYVHNQHAGNPDKPFLIYLAPGSTHAPHQAPQEYIDRFRGQFDQGWDQMRVESWRRQIAMGIIPADTKLTERPEAIPAWNTLTADQKAFHARQMEVAAAQLAFQDEQFGRILGELDRMGKLDNTLVAVVLGDNGASAENGPAGSLNELHGMSGGKEREEWRMAMLDEQGGPRTYQNYGAGWSWAMNTPFRWVKQFASMLGGIRNGAILSYPGKVAAPGSVCSEFGHVNDIVPTILDAARIPAPTHVLGAEQKPMDGRSLLPSLAACDGDRSRTQYFEIGGKIGLFHNGWFLSGEDHRTSWENVPPGGTRPEIEWTLYDLTEDFSQSTDLSAREPERLKAMIERFGAEARANDVYPLDHRFAMARAIAIRQPSTRKRFEFWGKNVSVPANQDPVLFARPFTLEAELELASADASGAIVALGSHFGGWSLYLDDGRPAFVWAGSVDPQDIHTVRSDRALPSGKTRLTMRVETAGPAKPADVILSSDGVELARLALPTNIVAVAGNGELLDIGRDLGVPVTEYRTPQGQIEGDIPHVVVTFD